MRKTKKLKKLHMTKETVRNISDDQIVQVAGYSPGSLTSGSVHGGGCCVGCGCYGSRTCDY